MELSGDVCYMGTGDNQKTLKLRAEKFHKIVEKYERLKILFESWNYLKIEIDYKNHTNNLQFVQLLFLEISQHQTP